MSRRDTRPLRPLVRAQVVALLAISPEGRTMPELRAFLVTQRPASRDTVARVLADMLSTGLVSSHDEPVWRRRIRASLAATPTRRVLRGRSHQLFVPTRALHEMVLKSFPAFSVVSPLTME